MRKIRLEGREKTVFLEHSWSMEQKQGRVEVSHLYVKGK